MPTHVRRGSTPVMRHSPATNSPTKILRQDAFSSSPKLPSSPIQVPVSATRSDSKRTRQIPNPPTFDGIIAGHEAQDHDDGEDPHDLAYTPRHFPRSSMVDNLVMSLDQFSGQLTGSVTHTGDINKRDRSHTSSSSISSEKDIPNINTRNFPGAMPRVVRRNSAKFQRNNKQLPSIFGEDEESVRLKAFDAQRAIQPTKSSKTRPRTHTKGSKSSGSTSSIDLGHLAQYAGRLGPAGNRRSRSFDYGSQQRQKALDLSYADECSASPVVISNPGSLAQPSGLPVRRNSAKSSKSIHVYNTKAATFGTNTVKNIAPPFPKSNPTLSNGFGGRSSPTVLPAEVAPVPKPGLFKRFFTSSRSSATTLSAPVDLNNRPSQDRPPAGRTETPRPTTPPNHAHHQSRNAVTESNNNKENQGPTVTKKSSAFFRRRKKSFSNTVPPPMPLTLNASVGKNEVVPGQSSPVSSLKAFMDPYLQNQSDTRPDHGRKSSLQPYHLPDEKTSRTAIGKPDTDTTAVSMKTGGSPPRQRSKMASSNQNPYPINNSGLEDLEADQRIDQSHGTPISGKKSTYTISGSTSTQRLTVETRSSSLQSAGLRVPQRNFSSSSIEDADHIDSQGTKMINETLPHQKSDSDMSIYKSAPSTPLVADPAPRYANMSPQVHVSHPSISSDPSNMEVTRAQAIFDNGLEDVGSTTAAAWLGDSGSERERVRKAYMELFDWTNHNILAALRILCSRLKLKGESQQVDRILESFSQRWCQCNSNHGFRSADVVHTICYSILLLNTDLHLADIGQKMTRNQFVKNAMQTIRPVACGDTGSSDLKTPGLMVRSNTFPTLLQSSVEREARSPSALSTRPIDRLTRENSVDADVVGSISGLLVQAPFLGSEIGWESQIEIVLKEFYFSIAREPLPLFGSENLTKLSNQPSNNNLLSLGVLRRTPSTLSRTQTDIPRGRTAVESKSLGARWSSKTRSRTKLGSTQAFSSSRTSLDEQSSAWSPSMSSTWSKASLGKTLTSMSVNSLGTDGGRSVDYQSSIGFANALSQAIIREDQFDIHSDDGMKAAPFLEDESLELEGAPWAKEGMVKHKCHLEGVEKRSKDRNWNDCFAVIEKGWVRLFSFSVTAKSLRNKAKAPKPGGVVGGGNWQDNAEEVWKFMLRHTIASALPPPGYSKARPFVWALSLPTGAVHLFSVGTPDIVKEFVSTANFWSARLSKEPMIGGISSMEYGWGDALLVRASAAPEVQSSHGTTSPRPSTQLSMRSSIDHGTTARSRTIGDKIHISDWTPPQQSLMASQLLEVDQLKALQAYVNNVEEEFQKHNELRTAMSTAFSSKHPNHARAMNNWEKKSSYLLREIVKFRTYIDALQSAGLSQEKVSKMRRQDAETRMADDDSRAMYGSISMN